uniref:Uncharacterized protein n=1 Tax=Panagrolaimus sp. JU765 TaxID=591449 RepID=A0AC34R318_9BILA
MQPDLLSPFFNDVHVNETLDNLDGLKTKLLPHQKCGIVWMLHRENSFPRGGLLADEPGLGKTLALVSLILSQKNARENSSEIEAERMKAMGRTFEKDTNLIRSFSTLVVAPASVILQWQNEINKNLEDGKLKTYVFEESEDETDPHILTCHDVVFTTYHNVVVDKKKENSVLTKIGWERVILDEAHHIRNCRSQSYKACCELPAHARWASSGTPIHKKVEDLISLFDFLQIKLVGRSKEEDITICKSIILRRTKDQIRPTSQKQTIPSKLEMIQVSVQLDASERKCYESFGWLKQPVLDMVLQQACTHLFLTKHANHPGFFERILHRRLFSRTFLSSKLKVLLEELAKMLELGQKCVVVSQWTAVLEMIEWHLNNKGIINTVITGGIHPRKRLARVDAFNHKSGQIKVLLMSMGDAGAGLNLTGANHLFIVDSDWNPALEEQAIGRIHCIGQQETVVVHKLVVQDSIEQNVLELQAEKTLLVKEMFKILP